MRTLLTLCLLLAAPLALADAFSYDGEIVATQAAFVVTEGHDFTFDALQGDLIEIDLAWTASPTSDLDLLLSVPGTGCAIFPDPDAPCIVGSATAPSSCPDGREILTSEESLTLVAPADGTYRLGVASNLPGRTAYTVTIAVDGAAPDADGPIPTRYVQRGIACKLA